MLSKTPQTCWGVCLDDGAYGHASLRAECLVMVVFNVYMFKHVSTMCYTGLGILEGS